MTEELPALALLSQATIALAIEVDNEIERRLPHFTSKYGSITPGFGSPWLLSVGFWFNSLRFIAPGMISTRELGVRCGQSAAQVSSCINGLVRWGYVVHHADPNDSRPKPPRADWVVLPTTNGRRWHDAFTEVVAETERGWEKRKPDAFAAVRECLAAEPAGAPPVRPQFLPFLDRDHRTPVVEPQPAETEPMCLLSSMSRVLLAQAHRIEPGLPLGLALSANVVRAAADDGVLVRDLPARSGVAKQEATTMTNSPSRSGHISIEPDAQAKGAKRIRLTDPGRAALDAYRSSVEGWDPQALRGPLVALAPTPGELHAEGGWRSQVRAPDALPHFPVVTGHGGYPDGS